MSCTYEGRSGEDGRIGACTTAIDAANVGSVSALLSLRHGTCSCPSVYVFVMFVCMVRMTKAKCPVAVSKLPVRELE
jgi:hypothetical protein